MAEVLIQRKRHRNVWPWLLGLLALALLPLLLRGNDRSDAAGRRATTARDDTTAQRDGARRPGLASRVDTGARRGAERTTAIAAGTVAPAVPERDFGRFIASSRANADERGQREYTSGGLRRLADTLAALGASGAGVRAIRANADSLHVTGPRSTAHPDHVRAAFLAATRELDMLRARHRVAVDTGRLRTAAWAIQPDRQLAAQRDRIRTFFETARDALQSVSRVANNRR